MRPGRAPIVEGRIETADKPWHRRWPPLHGPAEIGLVAFLTIFCWGLWIHLVLPLAGLVLWWLGVELLVAEVFTVRYADLSQTLLSYTGVFLVMASLFGLWVLWNVVCHGGSVRRDDKLPRVGIAEVRAAFGLDQADLDTCAARASSTSTSTATTGCASSPAARPRRRPRPSDAERSALPSEPTRAARSRRPARRAVCRPPRRPGPPAARRLTKAPPPAAPQPTIASSPSTLR